MYPVMMNIQNKPVVIIGGGKVAARKIKTLLSEGAKVTVISPEINEVIPKSQVEWIQRSYQTGDLEGQNSYCLHRYQEVNKKVMEEAHPRGQFVNNTGDKKNSDFYNVAIASNKELSVMISTNGLSPSRSKEVRKKIEQLLDQL